MKKTLKNIVRKKIGKSRTIKKRVFSKKDYSSGDGMLTSVWGPSLWHSLHTISFSDMDILKCDSTVD